MYLGNHPVISFRCLINILRHDFQATKMAVIKILQRDFLEKPTPTSGCVLSLPWMTLWCLTTPSYLLLKPMLGKLSPKGAWNNGTEFKSTCCSWRDSGFSSQHPQKAAHNHCVTPWSSRGSLSLWQPPQVQGMHGIHIYTGRLSHIQIK